MDNKLTDKLEHELKECGDVMAYLDVNEEHLLSMTSQEYLMHLMENKRLQKKNIVKASGLDQIYAYQILSGKKRGERDKLLCLAIAMGLTQKEVNTWLYLNGKPKLYPRSSRDSIILYGLLHHLSVLDIDDLLYQANEPTLFD